MPIQQLKDYLDQSKIQYVSVNHSPAYTATEIAHRTHIKGDQLAKTVILNMDGHNVMVVLPASCRIRWDHLMDELGTDFIALAEEADFQDLFPGCELGAIPPFGNLFDIPVYMFEQLTKSEEIAFCAGSHSEILKINLADYLNLVKPTQLSRGCVRKDAKRPAWLNKRKTG